MKNKLKYSFFCIFIFLLTSCAFFQNSKKITMPEYTKEIVEYNAKFNNALDEILDQIETYSGTDKAKERFNSLIDNAVSIINYLQNDLGPRVPDEAKNHYKNMMEAYNLYLEGLELYRNYIPASLSEERKNKISLAEDKFEQALQKIKSIK